MHPLLQAALLAYNSGGSTQALTLLDQALTQDPQNPQLHRAYGHIARESGHPQQALHHFQQALAQDPQDATTWNAAGVCHAETNNPAAALEHYLHAQTLNPNLPDTYSNIGAILLQQGDLPEAATHFKQAIAKDPTYTAAWTNLALAYRLQLDYPRALETFRAAHALAPDTAQTNAGLGELLSLLYSDQARPQLERAITLAPSIAEHHWNLSLDHLKHGRCTLGFREYQFRFQRIGHNPPRPFTQPQWLGPETPHLDPRNQIILLHAEQGMGDTLQMLRYLPLVAALHPKQILLEVQPPLLPLINHLPHITALAHGDPLPPFDLHTPLMSLPLAFSTTLETIPPTIRLTPPPAPLQPGPTKRIGLAWSGNPHHDRDNERSIPFHLLTPLLDTPNIDFISLQPAAQSPHPRLTQPTLNNFADTATLLDTLDLVLTVDTAVAHLAATQAIPTWLLLPYVTDWRWLPPIHTGPNPWYPNLRIFRQQTTPTNPDPTTRWQPVLTEVAAALRHLPSQ